jgi:4-hydroxybutyryl-CoA dehydratase/vinylacetyl-CoA-Delta-isomerase
MVESSLTGKRVNRFLHVAQSAEDLVAQNMMQRKLGQNTGTCFQRCVGMDAFNSLYSVTYEIDEKHGTQYHERLKAFLTTMQERNYVVGGAMTDVKGDRSKAPHEQGDPDLFVHITRKDEDGIWLKGAKAHQTGCINSHWIIAMPTMRLGPADEDYAVVAAFPVEAPGITYVYGRQSCDTRSMEGGSIDIGKSSWMASTSLPRCSSSDSPATIGEATSVRRAWGTCSSVRLRKRPSTTVSTGPRTSKTSSCR